MSKILKIVCIICLRFIGEEVQLADLRDIDVYLVLIDLHGVFLKESLLLLLELDYPFQDIILLPFRVSISI